MRDVILKLSQTAYRKYFNFQSKFQLDHPVNCILLCQPKIATSMDYSEVDPKDADGVGSAQLAAVVNRFAVTTCTFLASFAAECEARLGEQEARVQRVEAAVTLLEQKLGECASVWFRQIVLKPPVRVVPS